MTRAKQFRIAVDFDGTCVLHRYPDVGHNVPGAIHWLKRLQSLNVALFLWTMRSDGLKDGDTLSDAQLWFEINGIRLTGSQRDESQASWTNSPKLYAHAYVDDAAAGVPLIYPHDGKRPYLDWSIVGPWLEKQVLAWNEVHSPKEAEVAV